MLLQRVHRKSSLCLIANSFEQLYSYSHESINTHEFSLIRVTLKIAATLINQYITLI